MPIRRLLDRSASRLPRPLRTLLDWVFTVSFAIGVVLTFQAEVAKPYRIPTSSMEPTLHCARPAWGCLAAYSDRVIANRLAYRFGRPERGDIVVFETPRLAKARCNAGGTFVKRLIALPGEVWEERGGFVYINGQLLIEPYIRPGRRDQQTIAPRRIASDEYFFMGDNRSSSCDSRRWGTVHRSRLIGRVDLTYWPPNRLSG
jgi:signal peptidase I